MISTRRERLIAVRDHMTRFGPEHFDMMYWVFVITDEEEDVEISLDQLAGAAGEGLDIGECGTTACLFGHAVLTAIEHGWRHEIEYDDGYIDSEAVARWLQVDESFCAPDQWSPSQAGAYRQVVEFLDREIEGEA